MPASIGQHRAPSYRRPRRSAGGNNPSASCTQFLECIEKEASEQTDADPQFKHEYLFRLQRSGLLGLDEAVKNVSAACRDRTPSLLITKARA